MLVIHLVLILGYDGIAVRRLSDAATDRNVHLTEYSTLIQRRH